MFPLINGQRVCSIGCGVLWKERFITKPFILKRSANEGLANTKGTNWLNKAAGVLTRGFFVARSTRSYVSEPMQAVMQRAAFAVDSEQQHKDHKRHGIFARGVFY